MEVGNDRKLRGLKRYKMNKFTILFAILAFSCVLGAGNSIFSYDGLPVRYFGNDIYGLSMGDTGSADVFRYNSGFGNPALHNASNRTILATGLLFGYTRYQSESVAGIRRSFVDDSLDLPYFSLSIPLKRHRLGFQFNSYASGLVSNQISYQTGDSLQITEKQTMDRYLYRGDLIYRYKLGHYSFGISGNYYFGHDVRSLDQDAGYFPYNTHEELSRTYKNPSVTLGGMASFDKLSLGAYYNMGTVLKGESVRSSLHTSEPEEPYEFELPHQAGLGISFLPFGEHKLNVDAHYEAWKQVDDQYEDSMRLGIGWAYEPKAETRDSYLSKIPLRGGVSWRKLPFRVEDNTVEEYALSLGASFPLKRDINRLDVGFQILSRGSLNQNKLSDTAFMMMLGFTGFDIIGKGSDRTAPRDIPEKEELNEW